MVHENYRFYSFSATALQYSGVKLSLALTLSNFLMSNNENIPIMHQISGGDRRGSGGDAPPTATWKTSVGKFLEICIAWKQLSESFPKICDKNFH